jgi:hypothetical protein
MLNGTISWTTPWCELAMVVIGFGAWLAIGYGLLAA